MDPAAQAHVAWHFIVQSRMSGYTRVNRVFPPVFAAQTFTPLVAPPPPCLSYGLGGRYYGCSCSH